MSIASSAQLNASSYTFQVPATGMTLKRYRTWAESEEYPQRGKVLYYQGELYFDMSPERIDSHSALKEAINFTIGGIVRANDLGRYYPDGAGLDNRNADVGGEPDALFAKWETIKSGKLSAPVEKQGQHTALEGTPDWVCEIVSDSSVTKDNKVLRAAYHAAGIPEYWLIDARRDEIDFQLLQWVESGYEPTTSSEGWLRSDVFGLDFQLSRKRDQVGWWLYDLKYR